MYANCLNVWYFKLKSEIVLSTTETKRIILSQDLPDFISIICLLYELQSHASFSDSTPKIHFTTFKDNKEYLNLVNSSKISPQTKHIVLKYHRFTSDVCNKIVSIQYVDTSLHIMGIFNKTLNKFHFACV